VPHYKVDGGIRLPFRHNGTICVPEKLSCDPQTTLQDKATYLVIVMKDWGQLHTNATLLKPAKHSHGLFKAPQGNEKGVWKSRLGYL